MKKTIILITSSFPWGNEPFLETEINYYKDMQVLIFPVKIQSKERPYSIKDNNISVFRPVLHSRLHMILAAFVYLFSRDCVNEIWNLLKTGRFSYRKLIRIAKVSYYARAVYHKIRKQIKRMGKSSRELVFYGYWMEAPAYAAILLKRKFRNCKAVARCHGYDLYEERQQENYLSFRNQLKELDAIYPISEDGKKYLKKKYSFLDPGRICLSRLGVANSAQKKAIRNENEFHILTCSNLIPLKRIDKLIKTLKLVTKETIHWTHIGDGVEADRIKELAETELKENIIWELKGFMENKEVLRLYREHYFNLFLNVSESEGIPVSIMEACSFEIPVIATDVGGNEEIVRDGVNGMILRKDFTEEELKEKILQFYYMDQEQYERYRKNSYCTWKKYYDADVNYKKFIGELQK